jgi:hypothetical protein
MKVPWVRPAASLLRARLRARLAPVVAALLALAMVPGAAGADVGAASAAAVKVAFIFNFGKFVEWPPEALKGASNFTVCTAGDVDEFRDALNELENRHLQGMPIHVRDLGKSADLTGCQTLFIAQSERDRAHDLLKAAQPLHILTVSDMDDFAENGGIIGLLTRNGRVQFNVNAKVAKNSGLEISAELLGLARQVIGQENN